MEVNHSISFFLWLLIASIATLFLGLIGALFYSVYEYQQAGLKIPNIFFLSTICIIAASLTIEAAKKFYKQEEEKRYHTALLLAFVLTLVFLYGQCKGWFLLFTHEIGPEHSQISGYLYLISGLHLLHVSFGLPFLVLFLRRFRKSRAETHFLAIYFSDESQKQNLDFIARYWHFLDILWIFLFLIFQILWWLTI